MCGLSQSMEMLIIARFVCSMVTLFQALISLIAPFYSWQGWVVMDYSQQLRKPLLSPFRVRCLVADVFSLPRIIVSDMYCIRVCCSYFLDSLKDPHFITLSFKSRGLAQGVGSVVNGVSNVLKIHKILPVLIIWLAWFRTRRTFWRNGYRSVCR